MEALAHLALMGSLAFVIGFSFTWGVVAACKWHRWAPINFTSQLNDFRDSTAEYNLRVLTEKTKGP